MANIRDDINSGEFKPVYFFCGEEEYLNDYYCNEVTKKLVSEEMKLFNYLSFNIDLDVNALENFLNSPPVMNPKKVVYIKECDLCQRSSKEDVRERVKNIISELPSYAVVLINESAPQKTMAVFKAVQKYGKVIEHKFQKSNVLQSWVVRYFEKDGYKISPQDALYLVENGDKGMYDLKNEMEKLMGFKAADKIILKEDIEKCIVKSLESRVFEMIDFMINSQMDKALSHLSDLKTLKAAANKNQKVPVKVILVNIANEFTKMKKIKILEGRVSKNELSKLTGINPYFLDKTIKNTKKLSIDYINTMLIECQKTDFSIVSGEKEQWMAIEDLLIKSHNLRK